MWMNEYEIDACIARFNSHSVIGKYARFLGEFRDEVNAHSDGWAYWKAPTKAADKLMTLLQAGYPLEPALKAALAPIKSFYTRKGYAAGMRFPDVA